MIAQLKQIIQSANADYIVEFEESSMMNVRADKFKKGQKWAYIEEYRQGRYYKDKYTQRKSTIIQIYFCRFTNFQNNADQREVLRNEIENDIVLPFIDAFNVSGQFERVDEWQFFTPLPRFDANEVSIMLQFDLRMIRC
ncbi:MAG: hypothetical protein ACK5KP_11110 [Paludibacteraceae bacterium]